MSSSQSRQHPDIFIHYRTGKQWIRCQCGITMSRHFYFRNHFDMACHGIRYNLPNIILRIKAFLHRGFSLTGITTGKERRSRTFHPARSNFRKQRVTFDFNTPTIIIRQMQMQLVQFQHSHAIYDTQQILLRREKSGYVYHQSAIAETGAVGNSHGRYGPQSVNHLCTLYSSRQ